MPVVLSSIDVQNLGTCISDDTSAWRDHPDACSGSLGAKEPRWTRTWLTPPIFRCSRSWRLPGHDGGARSHALKLEIMWISVKFLLCPAVVELASGLDEHSLPEIHATGSTVRSARNYRDVKQVCGHSCKARGWTSREHRTRDNAQDGLCHEVTIPFAHLTFEVDLSVRPSDSGLPLCLQRGMIT